MKRSQDSMICGEGDAIQEPAYKKPKQDNEVRTLLVGSTRKKGHNTLLIWGIVVVRLML